MKSVLISFGNIKIPMQKNPHDDELFCTTQQLAKALGVTQKRLLSLPKKYPETFEDPDSDFGFTELYDSTFGFDSDRAWGVDDVLAAVVLCSNKRQRRALLKYIKNRATRTIL